MFTEQAAESSASSVAVDSVRNRPDQHRNIEDEDWLISFLDPHPPPQASLKDHCMTRCNSGEYTLPLAQSSDFVAAMETCSDSTGLFGSPDMVGSFTSECLLVRTDVILALDPRETTVLDHVFKIQAVECKDFNGYCSV